MKRRAINSRKSAALRQRAEELLNDAPSRHGSPGPSDLEILVHDFDVHRIELELQNEELFRAQSELAISHDRYQDLYDAAPVGYLSLDREGVIIEANMTVATLLDVPRGILVGSLLSDFVLPDDQDCWHIHRCRVFDGNDLQTGELRLQRKDGSTFFVQLESRVVSAADARHTFRTVVIDITTLKEAVAKREAVQQQLSERLQFEKEIIEAELVKVREDLVRSTRLATIGSVAAQMAHELRNPLGAVRNAAFYVRGGLNDDQDDLMPMLELIDDELATADIIIRNLLSATNPPAPNPRSVDVTDQVKKSFARLHAEGRVALRLDAPDEPLYIHFDLLQCRQLLDNLLSNACDAVGEAGEICVGLRSHDDRHEIRVTDSGPGIPVEQRQSVFEPFFTTKPQGIGLGLAICQQIVRRHGGRLRIEDNNVNGTEIVAEIPYNVR